MRIFSEEHSWASWKVCLYSWVFMQIESHTPFGNNYVGVTWFIVGRAHTIFHIWLYNILAGSLLAYFLR